MRNFYYAQTYNLMNPAIKGMLSASGIFGLHDNLSELKIRSKYFIGFYEASNQAQEDFKKKLSKIFPEAVDEKTEAMVKVFMIMNPKFSIPNQLNEEIAEKFGESPNMWDDNCCGTLFFCDANDTEEEEFPSAWMVKYEIFFEEDVIQLVSKNGEYAFNPADLAYSSSVH